MEPRPPELRAKSLSHWTTRVVHVFFFFFLSFSSLQYLTTKFFFPGRLIKEIPVWVNTILCLLPHLWSGEIFLLQQDTFFFFFPTERAFRLNVSFFFFELFISLAVLGVRCFQHRVLWDLSCGSWTHYCGVGAQYLWHWLSCSEACGILVPWPGIKPASPALQGRFLTTGPPGKSLPFF